MGHVESSVFEESCESSSNDRPSSDFRSAGFKTGMNRTKRRASWVTVLTSIVVVFAFVSVSFQGVVSVASEEEHIENSLTETTDFQSPTIPLEYDEPAQTKSSAYRPGKRDPVSPASFKSVDHGMVAVIDGAKPEVTLNETETSYMYESRFGNYIFKKSQPEIMIFQSQEGEDLVSGSSFIVRTSQTLIRRSVGILEASPDVFRVRYWFSGKKPSEGSMTIEYLFGESGPPKITADLALSADTTVGDFNIAWVLHTTDNCLVHPGGENVRFSQFLNPAPVDIGGNGVGVVACDSMDPDSSLYVDWDDAGYGDLSVGIVSLFDKRAKGIIVDFERNKMMIDPTLIGPDAGSGGTEHSIQRKTFYYNNYYWAFYTSYVVGEGMHLLYKVSHDGITWQYQRSLPQMFSDKPPGLIPDDYDYFMGLDVAQNGPKVAVVFYFGVSGTLHRIYAILGQIQTNKIYWYYGSCVPGECGAYPISPAIDADFGFSEPATVTIDANGQVWVSTTYYWFLGSPPDESLRIAFKVWRLDEETDDWMSVVYNDYLIMCEYTPGGDCDPDNKYAATRLLSLSDGTVVWFIVNDRSETLDIWFYWDFWNGGFIKNGFFIVDMEVGESRRDRLSMTVGSDDTLYAVYKGLGDRLKYVEIVNGDLSITETVCGETEPCSPFFPTISVDPTDDIHVFWKEFGEGIYYRRKGSNGWGDLEDNFDDNRWFVYHLSSAQITNDKVFLVFRRLGSEVHFASWPTAYSVSSGPVSGWRREGAASSAGGYHSMDEMISPSTGLLYVTHSDVVVPGRNGLDLSVNRIYKTPSVFKNNGIGPVPYLFRGFPYVDMGNWWSLDYPWIEGNIIHLQNGIWFPMQFKNGDNTFENHDGMHFTFHRNADCTGEPDCYKLVLPNGITYTFHQDGRPWEVWSTPIEIIPSYPTTKITFSYSAGPNYRLDSIEDSPGRKICFVYDVSGRLKSINRNNWLPGSVITTYDYYQDVLIQVFDRVGRHTDYFYGPPSEYPDDDALLSEIYYDSGAISLFEYDAIPVGTDAISFVVTKHSVHEFIPGIVVGPLIREDQYEYEAIDGKIIFSRVNRYDSNMDPMGSDERYFDSNGNSLIERNRKSTGTQVNMKKTWMNDKGQITQIDSYPGKVLFNDTPKHLHNSTMAYDEWGNVIYSRDSMAHETYFSFSNSDSRNHFSSPGVLVETDSNEVLYDNFDDWDAWEWYWAGSPTISSDYFLTAPPSIRIDSGDEVAKDFDFNLDMLWMDLELRIDSDQGSHVVKIGDDRDDDDGVFILFKFHSSSGEYEVFYCYSSGSICEVIEIDGNPLTYELEVWYQLGVEAYPSLGWYNIYLNGDMVKSYAPLGSTELRWIILDTEDGGIMYVSRVNLFESKNTGYPKGSHVGILNTQGSQTLYGRLVTRDGSVIDVERLRWDSIETQLHLFESGYAPISEVHIEVLENDGRTVYSSPFGINSGRSYEYHPHTEISNLEKTESGFWKVSSDPQCSELSLAVCVLLDEEYYFDDGLPYWPSQTTPESSPDDDWIWPDEDELLGAHGDYALSSPQITKQRAHRSEHFDGYRHHWFSGAEYPLDLDSTNHVLAQYVYIPSSAVPREIALRYHSFIGNDWLNLVYWGEDLIEDETKHEMGPIPDIYDRWLMLLVPLDSAGVYGPNSIIDGIDYLAYGGEVAWDYSVTKDRSDGSVIKFSNLASAYHVVLYDEDGNQLSMSDPAGGDGIAILDACIVDGICIYPAKGYFVVYDGSEVIYMGPVMDNIWAGDEYEFKDPEASLPSAPPHFYPNDEFLLGPYGTYIKSNQLGSYSQHFGRFLESNPYGDIESYSLFGDHLLLETKTLDNDRWMRTLYENYDSASFENLKSVCDSPSPSGGCESGYLTEYEWSSNYQGTYLTEVKNTVDGVVVRTRYGYDFDTGNLLFEQKEKGIQLGDDYRIDYEYDEVDRMTKQIFPLVPDGPPPYERAEIETIYNDQDNTVTFLNENDHREDLVYDDLGRTVKTSRLNYGSIIRSASFLGEGWDDQSGHSVAVVGDVNGDGFDDFVIGAPGNDDNGLDAGKAYLILGKYSGWTIDTDLSDADASFLGESVGDHSGDSVAGAGDVNNDGYDDFLIGALHNNEGGIMAGKTYLIFGKPSGWSQNRLLSTADASFIGEANYDFSGHSVAGAGNVNNDEFDDILIGAYGSNDVAGDEGQTYLILGKETASWSTNVDLSFSDASFVGESEGDGSGWSVAGAGNVNGDEFDDIIIGAQTNDEGGFEAGQAYFIYGRDTAEWYMHTSLSSADASFVGESPGDTAGYSVAGAGNVNGDEYDDVLIGAMRNDEGGSEAGKTYLILGSGAGWPMYLTLSEADASFIGEEALDWSGVSITGLGNVDGDQYDDFLIGAYGNDEGGSEAGQSYLIYGKDTGEWIPNMDLSSADASFVGESGLDYSGYSVSGSGDINKDGFDDILVGAYGNDDVADLSGQTYLVFGGQSRWVMDTALPIPPSLSWIEYSWVLKDYYWNNRVKTESHWSLEDSGPTKLREFTHEYDYLGRITKTINPDPLNYRTYWYYDDYDFDEKEEEYIKEDGYGFSVQWADDATSRRSAFFFDWNGNLLQSWEKYEGNWLVTECQYDEIGNMVERRDSKPSSEVTNLVYDSLGRLEEVQYDDGTDEEYFYDEAGDLYKYIGRNPGQEKYYVYDSLHRTKYIVYEWETPGDPTSSMIEYLEFNYDLDGNVESKKKWVPDGSGNARLESSLTYTYDERDRPVSKATYFLPETYWDWILPPGEDFGMSEQLIFDYDKASNLEEYNLVASAKHDNWEVTQSYDDFDRLSTVAANSLWHQSGINSFEYYGDDSVKSVEYENGVTTSYEYWEAGFHKSIGVDRGAANLLDLQYSSYYDDGNLETVDYSYDYGYAAGAQNFEYDELNRITRFEELRAPWTDPLIYTYDSLGNRQTMTGFSEGSFDYLYEDADNKDRLTGIDKDSLPYVTFDYYENGNLKIRMDDTYEWEYLYDDDDQLIQINRRPAMSGEPFEPVAQYFYDADGQRIMVAEKYDVSYNFKAYINIGNIPVYEWNYIDHQSIFLVYGNGQLLFSCTPDFHPNSDLYYHQDAFSNTRMATSSTGQIRFYSNYRPFGQQYDVISTPEVEFKYAGKPEDPLTGFYYFGVRYYDPGIGRFITEDPVDGSLKNPQSLNPYVYVLNNPYRFSDPTGAFICGGLCIAAIIALIAIGSTLAVVSVVFPGTRPYLDAAMMIIGFIPVFGDAMSGAYFLTQDALLCAQGECDAVNVGLDLAGLVPLAGDIGKLAKGGRYIDLIPFAGRFAGQGNDAAKLARNSDELAAAAAPDLRMQFHVLDEGGCKGGLLPYRKKLTDTHHLLPKKHIKWFKAKMYKGKNINIDDFTIELDPMVHWIVHGKGKHYKNWVHKWDDFITDNWGASGDEIMEYLGELRREYGI